MYRQDQPGPGPHEGPDQGAEPLPDQVFGSMAAHPVPDRAPDGRVVDPVSDPDTRAYDTLLAEARTVYPGVAVGHPGRSRSYWPTIAVLRALRLRWAVDLEGADHVAPGPAILIGNHVHFLDPVCLVMTRWWRVSAFTKFDWFDHPIGPFFRLMGQIPLRRGDPASTEWAMQMSRHALREGGRIGIYPEGTRTPDPAQLHKLHKRILVPLLEANPDVPVHVVATRYIHHRPPRRIRVKVRVSDALALDTRTLSPDELIDRIRDALLDLGGQTYVDRYAQEVKAERQGTGRR